MRQHKGTAPLIVAGRGRSRQRRAGGGNGKTVSKGEKIFSPLPFIANPIYPVYPVYPVYPIHPVRPVHPVHPVHTVDTVDMDGTIGNDGDHTIDIGGAAAHMR